MCLYLDLRPFYMEKINISLFFLILDFLVQDAKKLSRTSPKWPTVKPVYSGHTLKPTPVWSGKKSCPKISVYFSKSHKANLSQADTCLKRTKVFVSRYPPHQRTYNTILMASYRVTLYIRLSSYHEYLLRYVVIPSCLLIFIARLLQHFGSTNILF